MTEDYYRLHCNARGRLASACQVGSVVPRATAQHSSAMQYQSAWFWDL